MKQEKTNHIATSGYGYKKHTIDSIKGINKSDFMNFIYEYKSFKIYYLKFLINLTLIIKINIIIKRKKFYLSYD